MAAEAPDAGATLIIHEFMAVNSTLTDIRPVPAVNIYTEVVGEPEYADWIELKNRSQQTISLAGWHLTDNPNNLSKWSFPAGVTIPAGGYVVVYASNKDEAKYGYPFFDDRDHLHTNFELSLSGEYLALVRPDGKTIEHEYHDYPPQRGLVSYGVTSGADQQTGYLVGVTVGAKNTEIYAGVVEEVQFSQAHGFYDQAISLTLSCATSGVKIRFTLDNSTPTATHGTVYSQPLAITKTTCVRAAAFKSNHLSSTVQTQTYLFLENVAGQTRPSSYPNQWRSGGDNTSGDYDVDPDITDPAGRFGNLYAATFEEDLLSIPSISIVAPIEDLFGSTGIYVNESQDGTERFGSAELLDPNGIETFTTSCGIRMQGGAGEVSGGGTLGRWKNKKLSMRLMFRGIYGGQFKYPLFGAAGTDAFDTIVLDSCPQNSWTHSQTIQQTRGDYVRDELASYTQLVVGGYACHGRPLHLYINGLYWGLYWMHERPDAAFAASYLGGDKEDYDVIKHVWYNAIDGDNGDYLAMFSITPTGRDHLTAFQDLQQMLDVNDFIDYMITNYYLGNGDWDHKNWYATRNRFDPEGRWRWHMWDGEHVMAEGEMGWFGRHDNTGYRITDRAPTGLHWDWIRNDEYRMLFADRVHQHCFHDGPLTPENFLALFNHLTDKIDRAIVGESARWGDYRRSTPYTRNQEWLTECNRLRQQRIPNRRDIVLDQFTGAVTQYAKNPAWYPLIDPPEFFVNGTPQYGGSISSSDLLVMTAGAQLSVLYTLDGSDPRLPGGAVNPTANDYLSPVSLSRSSIVKARSRTSGGTWSALSNTIFGLTSIPEGLRVTELMYHPATANTEFIELQNIGTEMIDLAMVRFSDGVDYPLPSLTLAPHATLVVVENIAAFDAQYPHFDGTVVGPYKGSLSNSGETIELQDATGALVQRFTYQDRWYSSTDGNGYSLTILDPCAETSQWNQPIGWKPSANKGGSPGVVE
ncbi:lamin tail domain-containing protein [Planctomycetota bacterium]